MNPQTAEQILKTDKIYKEILADILNGKGYSVIGSNAKNTLTAIHGRGHATNNFNVSHQHQIELRGLIKEITEEYKILHKEEDQRLEEERRKHLDDIKRTQAALNSMIIDVRKLGDKFSKVVGTATGVILEYPAMTHLERTALDVMMALAQSVKNDKG